MKPNEAKNYLSVLCTMYQAYPSRRIYPVETIMMIKPEIMSKRIIIISVGPVSLLHMSVIVSETLHCSLNWLMR